MNNTTDLYSQLHRARYLVTRGEFYKAMQLLVEIRESSSIEGIDTTISNLLSEKRIIDVAKWLNDAMARTSDEPVPGGKSPVEPEVYEASQESESFLKESLSASMKTGDIAFTSATDSADRVEQVPRETTNAAMMLDSRSRRVTPLRPVKALQRESARFGPESPTQLQDIQPVPRVHTEPTSLAVPRIAKSSGEFSDAAGPFLPAESFVDAGSDQWARPDTTALSDARRLFRQGEFLLALGICKTILSRGADPDADALKDTLEGELERVQIKRIGSLQSIPTVCADAKHLEGMDLDHRAGFLLSQIDGSMTYEDLLELSSMPRFETLEVLARMIAEGAIESR